MGRGIFHMKWNLIPTHLSRLKLQPHGCVLVAIDAVRPSAEWGTRQKIIGIRVAFNVFASHTPDVLFFVFHWMVWWFYKPMTVDGLCKLMSGVRLICISLLPSLTYWEPWCRLKQTAHFEEKFNKDIRVSFVPKQMWHYIHSHPNLDHYHTVIFYWNKLSYNFMYAVHLQFPLSLSVRTLPKFKNLYRPQHMHSGIFRHC
jgi:hypothetical protein